MKKVLAISSVGGHWIQLLRLQPAFENYQVVFVSTHEGCRAMVKGHKFYKVQDSSRWSKRKLLVTFWQILKIIFIERPEVIISTGAAPGLMGMIIGRLLFMKTIWIDSIANVEKVSMSGKIALVFASRVYTQWPGLESKKIIYSGNVFS